MNSKIIFIVGKIQSMHFEQHEEIMSCIKHFITEGKLFFDVSTMLAVKRDRLGNDTIQTHPQ